MENPYILRYDTCNCPTGKLMIEKCYNNDPRYLVINEGDSTKVFSKNTLLIVKKPYIGSSCCEFPVKGIVPPVIYPHLLLIGKYCYADVLDCGYPKFEKTTVELTASGTVVNGKQYSTNDELYDAIFNIVTDCSCSCTDEPDKGGMPSASIQFDANPQSPGYGQPTGFYPLPGGCTPACYWYAILVNDVPVHSAGAFGATTDAFADYSTQINSMTFEAGDKVGVQLYGTCSDTCSNTGGTIPPDALLVDSLCFVITDVSGGEDELRIDITLLAYVILGDKVDTYKVDTLTSNQTGFDGTETFQMYFHLFLPFGTAPGGAFNPDVTVAPWNLIGNNQGYSTGLSVGNQSFYIAQRISYNLDYYYIFWFIDQENNVNHSYSVDGGMTWFPLNGTEFQHLLT